ncbi:MAG: DnaJ domain-containing protein [Bacteroidota bacterium]
MTNYYHVLGLSEDASPAEIKAAFKRLAVKYHPDKHPGKSDMEEKFKEVNQAHQVLSDPYEKARFDLKLKYQQFTQQSHTHNTAPRHDYSYPRRPYRQPNRAYGRIDQRQNIIATAYAFGITFLIAAIVMGTVWAKRSYDNNQHQKVLMERRATFEQAKQQFDEGNYLAAFDVMTKFKFFDLAEKDMKEFKKTMVDQIIQKADQKLSNEQYDAAITLYQLVFELKPEFPWNYVKKNLAIAYQKSGKVDDAIKIYKNFLIEDFEHVSSLVALAEIYRDQKKDYELAMSNFQLAHKLAVKRYKKFYGEAYPIVIKQEHLPRSHYELYSGLADMFLRMGEPDMSIKACEWNKYIWPDSTSAYETTAKAYIALGLKNKACIEFEKATSRGWKGNTPVQCN